MYTRVQRGENPLFIEGKIRPEMRGGYIEADAYAAAMDNLIIVCVDVVIIDSERRTIYLAKRRVRPLAGLWWIGGRRNKGETPLESIRRCFRRETTLNVAATRFRELGQIEYIWTDREQAPQNHGSHNIATQFTVELTTAELTTVRANLNTQEYDADFGLQEFSRARLLMEGGHPAILEIYDKIFAPRHRRVGRALHSLYKAIFQ